MNLELVSLSELTLMPSSLDMALSGRSARRVLIVLKAGTLPKPATPTMKLKIET